MSKFCVQIARYLRYFKSSNETMLSTLYNEWQVLKSQVPKGFEKYFPGGKKAPAKPEEAPKAETKGLLFVSFVFYMLCMFCYCICIVWLHSLYFMLE